MKLYIKRLKDGVDAVAEYDKATGAMTVLKGSHVSNNISQSEKFRGAKTIERLRKEYVENGIVIKDVVFRSSSTAANFVTGSSSNGLKVWKDENGNVLKAFIAGEAEA